MEKTYLKLTSIKAIPRLPMEASIDLTYRCNNNCRHCWLRISTNAREKEDELSFDEIKGIVDNARNLGCRHWSISGGEPMLRPDFPDIFDYITNKSISYSLNTNGTLITPKIAQILKSKGNKMVALYGATADVHDRVTRNPGSFDAVMRGFAYLKEAGAGFVVQIIPMRDNFHQYEKMIELAKSLSNNYRIGAPWLYLSACGDSKINNEIKRQRLSPKDVVDLDKPDLLFEGKTDQREGSCGYTPEGDNRLFAACISNCRNFHIDPYGKMSFCSFIKDPSLRYDLRKGTVADGWDRFIPSITDDVRGTKEYMDGCSSCDNRKNCRWCPVYAYLEHGDYSKKVEHLCAVAEENRKYKENWKKAHRVYYKIGEITVQVDSDKPIQSDTFHSKFDMFKLEKPGDSDDIVSISHHFELPNIKNKDLGKRIYFKPPWAIYKKGDSWIYLGIHPETGEEDLHKIAVFNNSHTRGTIYNKDDSYFQKGGINSLTFFPTDQILLGRVLADREGCIMHSCGIILDGKGFLFVGHSSAGKSTTSLMMRKAGGKILCDDRNIIRKKQGGFRVYGTWSHGDVSEISSESAPLNGIFFLEQAKENTLIKMDDKKDILKRLLACIIKPFVTNDWWEKELTLLEQITLKVPCYRMLFDKSGDIVEKIRKWY